MPEVIRSKSNIGAKILGNVSVAGNVMTGANPLVATKVNSECVVSDIIVLIVLKSNDLRVPE